ncbi:MAG TPA: arginine deiminase family protein [Capillimicrobium sp.]|jgi:N-dimethylarginine dimethylaminohydrolase
MSTVSGEAQAVPAQIIVHDPATAGALDRLGALPDPEVRSRFAFTDAPDPARFARQHEGFVAAIAAQGVEPVALGDLLGGRYGEALELNPNHVYTRDSAVTLPWTPDVFVRGKMREPIRRHEPAVMGDALTALGLRELARMPAGVFLEGGDVIPFAAGGRRVLLVGYGPRSAPAALHALRKALVPEHVDEVIGIELARWRINLDGVIVPVADDVAVAHPGSVERAVRVTEDGVEPVDLFALLADHGVDVVEITAEEAKREACNCLCLGHRRIVCYDHNERVLDALRDRGIDVIAVAGDELLKGTGGPRCMTRPVYRAA